MSVHHSTRFFRLLPLDFTSMITGNIHRWFDPVKLTIILSATRYNKIIFDVAVEVLL